jgi:hypothetical protein
MTAILLDANPMPMDKTAIIQVVSTYYVNEWQSNMNLDADGIEMESLKRGPGFLLTFLIKLNCKVMVHHILGDQELWAH